MSQSYSSIRDHLDTGDLVGFSGKGGISSTIKWFTGSKWSHVGMVLRVISWDCVLLWESTTLSNIADVESGQAKMGVQLVPLSERLRRYRGEAAIRQLKVERTEEMLTALANLRYTLRNRPYEQSKLELIKAAYDGPLGSNTEDLSTIFCSELTAEAYQAMELVSSTIPSSEYTPKDFLEPGRLDLLKGSLSSPIPIRYA